MANGRYTAGKQALGDGDIDFVNDDIRVVIVDAADYTVDLANHNALDDIPSGARIATGSLANQTNVGGVLNADDTPIAGVTGDVAEALVIYKHTGTESTSTLLGYIDTGSGLPLTPNSGLVTIEWHASGIYAI